MKKIPIIIDTDPGHDDAIALIVALASEKLDVKGITTVAGNSTIEKTTNNALSILHLLNIHDIPVVKGRSNPMMDPVTISVEVHGESGMDGPELPEHSLKTLNVNVIDFMKDTILSSEEPVIIATLGPMTNVAVLLLTHPEVASNIKYISAMGGGIVEGNRTPTSEFNIWNDPEATSVILKSGVEVRLHGLDVTHKSYIKRDEFENFRNKEGEIFKFVADLLDFYALAYVDDRKMPGTPMHDSCAIMGVIDPDIFDYVDTYVDIDLAGFESRGSLLVDLRPLERRYQSQNTRIYTDVDREEVLQHIIKACEYHTAKNNVNL